MIDGRQARHVVEQKELHDFCLSHPKGDENLIRVFGMLKQSSYDFIFFWWRRNNEHERVFFNVVELVISIYVIHTCWTLTTW